MPIDSAKGRSVTAQTEKWLQLYGDIRHFLVLLVLFMLQYSCNGFVSRSNIRITQFPNTIDENCYINNKGIIVSFQTKRCRASPSFSTKLYSTTKSSSNKDVDNDESILYDNDLLLSQSSENATNSISIVPSINMHSVMVAVDPLVTDVNNDSEIDESNGNIIDNATQSTSTIQVEQPIIDDTTNIIKNETDALVAKEPDDHQDAPYQIPTYSRLILFCSTTCLIWLSEPLLSLVDTTVVGLTQGSKAVVQLASLGPATTLIDSMLYLTYFLAIATTNQIAAQLAVKDYRRLQKTVSNVMGVAVTLGLICSIFVFAFAQPLLTRMAGLSGSVELIQFATKYAYIRASVAIVSVTAMTMQAMCLATFNTKTPSIAVLAASLTNVIGDIALRQYGVVGAAIATATSTVVSGCILFTAVRKKFKSWRRKEITQFLKLEQERYNLVEAEKNINKHNAVQESVARPDVAVSENQSVKLLNNDTKLIKESSFEIVFEELQVPKPIPLIALPDRKAAWKLMQLSGPLFFVIISKIACYSAMTLRCTDFGVEALAAHSIMMRIFFFYGCFGDSLSQTAQSFLPSTLYPKPNLPNFRKILQKLFVLACGIGFINRLGAVNILKHLGKYLTKDAMIIQLMRDNTHFIGAAILLHPFIVLLEGTVIASRDFATLIKTYVTTLPLHFFILKFFSGSFPAVWRTFFFFQSIRFCLYATRVSLKQASIIEKEKKLEQQQQATLAVSTANGSGGQ